MNWTVFRNWDTSLQRISCEDRAPSWEIGIYCCSKRAIPPFFRKKNSFNILPTWVPQGVIPEFRVRSNLCIPLDVEPLKKICFLENATTIETSPNYTLNNNSNNNIDNYLFLTVRIHEAKIQEIKNQYFISSSNLLQNVFFLFLSF